MTRSFLWSLVMLGLTLLVQTTLLSYVSFAGVRPDILLVLFAVLAVHNGSFVSQLVGFVIGIALDVVSVSPLGFHALLYTLAGYTIGLGSGKVYFDPLVMPALLGIITTVYFSCAGFLLNALFRLGEPWSAFFNVGLLFQFVLNALATPLVFWIYGLVRERFKNPRRGFGV